MGKSNATKTTRSKAQREIVCGIIMPISSLEGCTAAHWEEVNEILSDAIIAAGFTPSMVSEADDVGIIQKRIIQNLYGNPIAVCDVSGKNPNVMFELGMRLAFDKPTIIVKDDSTDYSFDTSPIEHLEYPRDLRFKKIVTFKQTLSKKIQGTHKKAQDDPDYTTFLKHFGSFTVAKLDTKEVSTNEFILDELKSLRQLVVSIPHATKSDDAPRRGKSICIRNCNVKQARLINKHLKASESIAEVSMVKRTGSHFHFRILPYDTSTLMTAQQIAKTVNTSARIM